MFTTSSIPMADVSHISTPPVSVLLLRITVYFSVSPTMELSLKLVDTCILLHTSCHVYIMTPEIVYLPY